MRTNYFYNKDTFESTFEIITNKGQKFIGKSKAHPDDQDYGNYFTGLYIAEARARLKREIYKIKKTKADIRRLENELEYKQKLLSEYENGKTYFEGAINTFIDQKDKLYKQYRAYKKEEENRDK